jgi:hypothetical protein
MLVSSVSSNVVQTSSSVSTGGVAPYCCSEPSCPCEGGRAAKAKLESQQLEQRNDAVSISSQAFERLASEATSPLLTIQAPAPVAEISASEFPESNQSSNISASLSAYQAQERNSLDELNVAARPGQVINTFA